MFDFAILQMRYVRGAMVQIPSFRPDGLGPDEVFSNISTALFVRSAYVTAKNDINGARALRRTSIETLHNGCVDFAAQGRSRFRKDATLVQRFDRLPTQDQTFQETMTRADMVAALWGTLPLVGAPPAAFQYGQGLVNVNLAGFTALQTAARTADAAIPDVDQAFQKEEGRLHVTLAGMDDFVSAAVATGRSRYNIGTAEREIIEAIPGSLPAAVPGTAVITELSTLSSTELLAKFTAPGATSYDVFWRIQGESDWTLAGDDVIEKEFTLTGGNPGTTVEVMIRPRNSRGNGTDSEPGVIVLPT